MRPRRTGHGGDASARPSSRHIHVELGIAHIKNWRALARHRGHREHITDIAQALTGLHSHQQTAVLSGNP